MKPAILFDLGNTLVAYYQSYQFEPILEDAIRAVLTDLRSHDLTRVSFDTAMQMAIDENRESPDFRVTPLASRLERIFQLSFAGHPDLSMSLCERFLRPIFSLGRLYDETLSVLETLTSDGYPTAIVSNTPWGSPPGLWRQELARLGLASVADVAVFCGDVGWRKPAPAIFRHAADSIGRDPRDCFFVGDDLDWDVAGSQAAGMRPVLIDRDMSHPDFAGERIGDLVGVVRLAQER